MATYEAVRVQPLVVFAIAESHQRRNEDQKRVIGTLIGNVVDDVVIVKDCFVVPHNETHDEVAVDMEFGRSMVEMRRRVNSSECVVGWFSSSAHISEHSALIQEYYARETPAGMQPIHLSLDTGLTDDRPSIQAHVSLPMGTPGKVTGAMFCRVPCSVMCMNAEKVALHHLHQPRVTGDVQHIEASCTKMLEQLNSIVRYVDAVIANEVKGDETVGRHLLDLVNSVPRMEPHAMHTMLNGTTQDLLMMMYMATLVETPLTLMERIRTAHL